MSLDADQVIWTNRELEALKPRILEERKKPLNALVKFGPASIDVDESKTSYTQKLFSSYGRAKIVNEDGSDLPYVNIGMKESTYKIVTLGCCYGYTYDDILRGMRSGQPAGFNLSMRQGMAAERAMVELHNDLLWNGDTSYDVKGLLTNPYIARISLANITSDTAAGTMLAWLLSPINRLRNLHGTNEWLPDRMDLATDIHEIVAQKVMGSGDTRTVLQTAQEILSSMGTPVEFTSSRELNAAGPNSENLLVAWPSGTEALEPNIPGGRIFHQLTPQQMPGTFTTVVPCRGKNGGLASWRPREVIIGVMATS